MNGSSKGYSDVEGAEVDSSVSNYRSRKGRSNDHLLSKTTGQGSNISTMGLRKKMRKRASSFATRDLGASLRHWPAMIKLYTLNFRRINVPVSEDDGEVPVCDSMLTTYGTPYIRDNGFADLPFLILLRITSYLNLPELAVLLQLPSKNIRIAALTIVSSRLHEVKDLASLHSLLSYGGMIPYFYRSSALLLFGCHFIRVLPEAWNVIGPLYAFFLGFFMVFLYAFPFLGMFIVFVVMDAVSSVRIIARLTYSRLEELLFSRFLCVPHNWRGSTDNSNLTNKVKTLYLYTRAVRRLQFLGTTQPSSKGLMNPWSSYLYLASSCYPNITYLHIIRCSLAWWFRIDLLNSLSELVLEECEIDESGIEIFAINCPRIRKIKLLSTNVRISSNDLPRLKPLSRDLQDRSPTFQESQEQKKLDERGRLPNRNALFTSLEEICIKSCHDGVDMFAIYFFLLTCPKVQIIRFTDSKILKDTFCTDYTRPQIIENENWYVITPYDLKDIKKLWCIS